MKLEQQVVSLDLTKRMKELGAPQESLFWWIRGEMEYGYEGEWHINETEREEYFLFDHVVGQSFDKDSYDLHPITTDIGEDYEKWEKEQKAGKKRMLKTIFSAYTVAELGEMLPAFNPDGSAFQQLHCRKNRNSKGDEWSVVYHNQNHGGYSSFIFFADTEADARAKMWIYLKENKLI